MYASHDAQSVAIVGGVLKERNSTLTNGLEKADGTIYMELSAVNNLMYSLLHTKKALLTCQPPISSKLHEFVRRSFRLERILSFLGHCNAQVRLRIGQDLLSINLLEVQGSKVDMSTKALIYVLFDTESFSSKETFSGTIISTGEFTRHG